MESNNDEIRITRMQSTSDIVRSVIERNTVATDAVPALIESVFETIKRLDDPDAIVKLAEPEFTPAVPVRKSTASREHILSLIDGKPYKMLRRHLSTNGLTPDEYRARYSLPADYPMVAPAYADTRRDLAKKIGLGRNGGGRAKAKAK